MNDEIMIINDDVSPNAAMPPSVDEESNEIMIISSTNTATPRFSDDEEDEDDEYASRSRRTTLLDHDYEDDDMLMITDDVKPSTDTYSTSILRIDFPFDRFRSMISERIQQLAISYASSTNQNRSTQLVQIYKQIASSLSDKRPLVIIQPVDPAGPIASFAMIKFEKTSEKFQSRLLSMCDEQTVIYALLCLWLLRDSFINRLLPTVRPSISMDSTTTNAVPENTAREVSPQKLKRSIKQSPLYVLFRLMNDDPGNQDLYIKLLQAMYFFQPELAYIFLYYLSVDVPDVKIAASLFDMFARDIIKLSSSHRK